MKSFDECLEKFNNKIQEFINEYRLLDDKKPFTLEIIDDIAKILNDNYSSSISETSSFERRKTKLEENFTKTFNEFTRTEKKRKNELKEKKENIKKDLENKINYSKKELTELKKQYEKNEYETINDINFYVDSSNQNIDMFEIEYKDNTNRFAYQIGVAKSSYNSNIDIFNSQLESQLEKLAEEYNKNIESSKSNFESLVESYNIVINEKNQLIENKKQEYNEAKITLNNKKRQEYVTLNNQIREFSDVKNAKIDDYKNAYVEAQTKDNTEKEHNNNDYKVQNFRANKEFVKNINELDNKIKILREEFDNYCQEINQNKYYNIYDLHLEQEKLVKQFMKNEKDEKKIKQEIKKINNLYYSRIMEEDKKTEKVLQAAEKEFTINTQKEVYQKKILDITRNTFFNKLNEKQTRNNKYYQEKTNGYEDLYNYNSSVALTEYNKKANKVLLDSSIRNLEIEKEIDETDAKFQIQIETLTDVIKKYQLEIQIAKRLNDLNILFLTEKYNREVSFLTVSNLLKIEKCKVLDLYNINQYELNIKNSKIILDYSKNKIKIQNEKYKTLKQQDILIQNKQLQNVISKTAFDEYSINFFSNIDEELLSKEYAYNTSINKTKLLREKYIVALDAYQNVLQSFIILYSNMAKTWNDVVDYIYEYITKTNDKIVRHFLTALEKIFKTLLNDLNDTYKELITSEISNDVKFDNDFKYKESYDDINKALRSKLDVVKIQKDALISDLERIKQRNDDLRLRIFTYQYEKGGNRHERHVKKKEIKANIKEVKENSVVIEELNEKISVLNKKTDDIQKKYDKQFNAVKTEQDSDNAPYQFFNTSVNKMYNEIKEYINNKEDDDSLSQKGKYKKKINFLSEDINSELFNNTTLFSIKYQENYNASSEKINRNYEEDLDNYKKINDANYEKAKDKFNKDNQVELNEIKNLIIEKTNIEKYYNNIIFKNDIDYKKNINEIYLAKKSNTNQFYTELYAVGDNLKDIEKDYYQFVKSHSEKYEIDKQIIIDETIETKNGYNETLKNYINNRKAIINHLPSAIKANEKELIDTYKTKNKELDEKLVLNKKELNAKNRAGKRNLNIIELNYNTAVVKLDAKDRIQKAKEKKAFANALAKAN